MKPTEMNVREKKAYLNIKYAANDLLGGLENTLQDTTEESEDHKAAESLLANHDKLVGMLYEMATTAIYGEGYCCFNPTTTQKELRDINFCGKTWLMAQCEARITEEGY